MTASVTASARPERTRPPTLMTPPTSWSQPDPRPTPMTRRATSPRSSAPPGPRHTPGIATTNYVVDDSGVLLRQTGTTTANFVTDRTSGQLLGQGTSRTLTGVQPYATVSGASTQALLLDHLGSIRDAITSAGAATSYSYSPFGISIGSAPTAAIPGFVGGLTQPDTSIRFGARSLDPTTGRWTSLDPTGLRENNQRSSVYSYVQNDPERRTDVTGKSSSLWSGIKTVVGIGNSVVQGLSSGTRSVVSTALGLANKTINAVDITKSLINLGSALFGSNATPNRATSSYSSQRVRDISGSVSSSSMAGSIDRFNAAVDNMDYSDFGGTSGDSYCVNHLYGNGLTGARDASVDGSKFSSSGYVSRPDNYSSGLDFFTDLITTSNKLQPC